MINMSKTLSEEHKIKISNSLKGKTPTEETKIKIANSLRGKKHPEEVKIKISNSLKGIKHTKESYIQAGNALRGIKLTEETKQKMSKARRGIKLSDETKRRIGEAFKGKKHTEERKMKMRGKKRIRKTIRITSEVERQSMRDRMKGDKNPRWQGGKVSLKGLIRKHYKYRQWRSDVYTRDNFTCQICGQHSGKLNADHIKSFSKIFHENNLTTIEEALICEELWNINNGRTLCHQCHRETVTYGGYSRIKSCN